MSSPAFLPELMCCPCSPTLRSLAAAEPCGIAIDRDGDGTQAPPATLAAFLLEQLSGSSVLDGLEVDLQGDGARRQQALLTVLASDAAKQALAAVPAESDVGRLQSSLATKRAGDCNVARAMSLPSAECICGAIDPYLHCGARLFSEVAAAADGGARRACCLGGMHCALGAPRASCSCA